MVAWLEDGGPRKLGGAFKAESRMSCTSQSIRISCPTPLPKAFSRGDHKRSGIEPLGISPLGEGDVKRSSLALASAPGI